MIQTDKTYKSEGRKVRIAFIENKVAHCFVEDINASEENKADGYGWEPMAFDVQSHMPYGWPPGENAESKMLIESKRTKKFSHTLYVLKSGKISSVFSSQNQGPDDVFAELTVNAEVEEGSNRVVTI